MLPSLSVVLKIVDLCLQNGHSLDHVVVLVHFLFKLLQSVHDQLVVIDSRDNRYDDC